MNLWATHNALFNLNSHLLLALALIEGLIASAIITYVFKGYIRHLFTVFNLNKQHTH